MVVFETLSIQNKNIRLTEPQWFHIRHKHSECDGQTDKMISTITAPDVILHDRREDVYHYLRHFQETPVTEKFMLTIVRHLNDEGFVITAFFVSKIRLEGKVKVYEKNIYKL
ncbi:MAG: hypothetical protein AB1742_13955 [bacterium]